MRKNKGRRKRQGRPAQKTETYIVALPNLIKLVSWNGFIRGCHRKILLPSSSAEKEGGRRQKQRNEKLRSPEDWKRGVVLNHVMGVESGKEACKNM